jgi:hypothetical protein
MRELIIAALVTTVAGCASVGRPHAPIVTTLEGRRCVHQCQAIHGRCLSRANSLDARENYWTFANPHIDECNERLSRCYTICPT